MARLHEHQGKAILAKHGVAVPRGVVVRSPEEAAAAFGKLGGRVILKVQAWITGRKAKGGVVFAQTPEEAASQAVKLLALRFGNFPVSEVLIEETIEVQDELFVSLSIDDAARAPMLLLDFQGGSGIEERAASVARLPVDPVAGVDREAVRSAVERSKLDKRFHEDVIQAVVRIVEVAKSCEARSVEINPLVTTRRGGVVAADCRMTIDDYAVFRHPELGIEIARELDHPPTELERIAYRIEEADHRGTFYFAQLPFDAAAASKGLIGFHGAGGGGSMMSMDAATGAGFTLANFCDTSGNPSAAKVYRAARVILSQPGLVGYFGSGSGVASQEQYHSAYGLAKAFNELQVSIPVVVRLGGNSEDRAVDILKTACAGLPAPVEGYKKDDAPGFCASRFADLVKANGAKPWQPRPRVVPAFVGGKGAYSFPIAGGRVWIDHVKCDEAASALAIGHSAFLLKADERGKPILAIAESEIANKDSELIALEIECRRAGKPVVFVDLPVPGIDQTISDFRPPTSDL